ncbi:MAG: hypothetical protein JW974_03020 [Alphaproteobacteria bacterium]|nr:hypothetical protein [Alphaproteobacteria bacterium]
MNKNWGIILILFIVFGSIFILYKKDLPKLNKLQEIEKNENTDFSEKSDITSLVYFTGIGCPHCAKVDPVLLKETLFNKNIIIVEYEIYQTNENAPLLMEYNNSINSGLGIPLIIAGNCDNKSVVGDLSILDKLDIIIKNNGDCITLANGDKNKFEDIDLSKIPGKPNIWYKNKIAIKNDTNSNANQEIKSFILTESIPTEAKKIKSKDVHLSGDKITFKQAVEFNGWILQWN